MSKKGGENKSQGNPEITQKALERLADILGIGLYKINLKTGDISLNHHITKFTGHDLNDLPTTDHTRDSLLVEQDRDLVNNAMHSILTGQEPYYRIEYRMRRRDTSIASFEEAAIVSDHTENGEPLCVSLMALDLSRLKWAEEKSHSLEFELKRKAFDRDDKSLTEENRVLRSSINAAAMVIGGFHQDYDTVLLQALQLLSESVSADYIGFWRNSEIDGFLNCHLKYHWTNKAHSVGGEEKQRFFKYDDLLQGWKEKLAENNYVISNNSAIPRGFIETYNMKGAKNILLIPFYLHQGFWAMLGVSRESDVPFTAIEAEALMAGTKIIAFSISRNEQFGRINLDRDKAKADTLAKAEFLSRMSHEMRTPLNAIIGMTNIALKEKDQQKIYDYLGKVKVSSQLMLNIINDVLDMSKIEAGKLEIIKEPFDFALMLLNAENIVRITADEKQQNFTVNRDPSIDRMIISDEHRLLQVIINLLNNAMKFTPKNGKISLTAFQKKIGENRVKLRVEVTDSGIGLTYEQQKKLFTAFEQADGSITRKYGGTGLGLAICKKILNTLGGDIWVRSKPNEGACFFFELEADLGDVAAQPEAAESKTTAEAAAPTVYDWKKYTILVADDVEINREIIEITLAETGINIVNAENGRDAINKYTEAKGKFNLILMDMQMPVMDGLSATEEIRAIDNPHAKQIPILAMTANAFREDIDRCIKAGMNAHIAKPIDMNILFETLNKYLK